MPCGLRTSRVSGRARCQTTGRARRSPAGTYGGAFLSCSTGGAPAVWRRRTLSIMITGRVRYGGCCARPATGWRRTTSGACGCACTRRRTASRTTGGSPRHCGSGGSRAARTPSDTSSGDGAGSAKRPPARNAAAPCAGGAQLRRGAPGRRPGALVVQGGERRRQLHSGARRHPGLSCPSGEECRRCATLEPQVCLRQAGLHSARELGQPVRAAKNPTGVGEGRRRTW